MQERTGELGWDDVRTVLAVVRAGSLSRAARALAVEHSTVFRRIEDIERRMGVRLFERQRSGYVATAHGETVAEAGVQMEQAALAAERRVLGADERLVGQVKIATSESLASHLLPEALQSFAERHAEIELEIEISNRPVDLDRREADMAVRATVEPPDTLIGRQLGEIRYAVYVSPAWLDDDGNPPSLDEVPWVSLNDRLMNLLPAQWLRTAMPRARSRLRFDSMMAVLHNVAAGTGAGVLPIFAAARMPGLVRITPPIENLAVPIWVLHHPDTRGSARVRALANHLAETVPTHLAELMDQGQRCQIMAECPVEKLRKRATAVHE